MAKEMTFQDDPRLDEAKAIPVRELVDRLGIVGLRPMSGELIGPCPLCGGTDRFGINERSGKYLCRRCGIKGGDQVQLARDIWGCSFPDALKGLCGDKPVSIDPKEAARRRAMAKEAEEKRNADAARYRKWAIRDAKKIWCASRDGNQGIVGAYLAARGIDRDSLPIIPPALRFIVDHPYVKRIGGQLETLHRGPCMIAGVLNQAGSVEAVHQTWVDVNPPHGKATITRGDESFPAKLVRGSKKGGAIRLHTPESAKVLVVGEGIETTLSAMIVGAIPNAAYWAGVDLGNMSGRMMGRNSGIPDMDDGDAFVPPPWVQRLVYIMDGDSNPKTTRAKLECGLRRAMALRPGLSGEIIHAGKGVDLNDVLVGKRQS